MMHRFSLVENLTSFMLTGLQSLTSSYIAYRISYKNGEPLYASLAITLVTSTAIKYWTTLDSFGLAGGVVNLTTSIRICLREGTKLSSGLSIELWIGPIPLKNYGFFACAMLLMFSTEFQIHPSTTVNPFLLQPVELAILVHYYHSHGYNLSTIKLMMHPSHLNHQKD